jgi:hypothetical protein
MQTATAQQYQPPGTETLSSVQALLDPPPIRPQFTPLALETRPTVDTAAYAYYMHIAPQTARIHACKESGPIRPLRIPGSSKLHWPVAEIRRVLGVTA